MRPSLYCLRCGACLNVCPVYQRIGGHAYGWVYSGPIGSLVTPQFLGIHRAKYLPLASTLCRACAEVCPVTDSPARFASDPAPADCGAARASLAGKKNDGNLGGLPDHARGVTRRPLDWPGSGRNSRRAFYPPGSTCRKKTFTGSGKMDKTDWLDRLELELKALQARTFRAGDPAALREILLSLGRGCPPETIAREDRLWLEKLDLEVPVYKPSDYGAADGLPPGDGQWKPLQGIAVGITGVDYARPETGTLVLASGPSGGRGLSLAPRHHIALLPEERILPSLDEFLDLYPEGENFLSQGSAVTFISGASRTADIELNLVLGAHGPKELSVITLCFPVDLAG